LTLTDGKQVTGALRVPISDVAHVVRIDEA
jgi:hypothetical protein